MFTPPPFTVLGKCIDYTHITLTKTSNFDTAFSHIWDTCLAPSKDQYPKMDRRLKKNNRTIEMHT